MALRVQGSVKENAIKIHDWYQGILKKEGIFDNSLKHHSVFEIFLN